VPSAGARSPARGGSWSRSEAGPNPVLYLVNEEIYIFNVYSYL